MTGRAWRAISIVLALAGVAACGLKGEPSPPDPAEAAPAAGAVGPDDRRRAMIETARTRALLLALALALGAGAVHAGGPVLLTVTGAVENANRGAVDPAHDKLFVSNHVAFDRAMEFDADTLAALPQATVRADFPKDGRIVSFTGPLLADVLAAAGATGATVTIQAMDGYAVEVASAAMTEKGAVVALARDGKPLGIGGFGPTQIVFPRAERADLAAMNDDWWIWQIYHIRVD